MLKILQDRLQQYVNHEFPDVQAEFRKMILKNLFTAAMEKLTFSSPVATAEFSKFAGILSAAL